MGRVIGKQGATIKDIRERSGCRVDAEDRDGDMCEFRLSGRPECVEMARKMILEIVNEGSKQADGARPTGGDSFGGGGGGGGGGMDDNVGETMEFPEQAAGAIIGSRGATIMDLRQQSNCRIKVEKVNGRCCVTLSGSAAAVERARGLVAEAVRKGKENEAARAAEPVAGDDGDTMTESIEFPHSATGGIIGTRGAKIADVRERSGAKVQVEKVDDRCRVTISGTPEQVRRARDMVSALAEDSSSPGIPVRVGGGSGACEENLELPLQLAGRIIGKGGETVQQMQRECGAKIEINARDRPDPCPVRISGTQQQVDMARRLIIEKLDGYIPQRRGGGSAGGGDGGLWGAPGGGCCGEAPGMMWGGFGGAPTMPPWGAPPMHGAPMMPPGPMPPMPGFWAPGAPPANGPCASWDVPAGDGNAGCCGGGARNIDLDEL